MSLARRRSVSFFFSFFPFDYCHLVVCTFRNLADEDDNVPAKEIGQMKPSRISA